MSDYSHKAIWINNREVTPTEILSGGSSPTSEFESHTFSFIKDWLNGVDSIKLQTSGSTSDPKEITLTRDQLKKSAQRTINTLALDKEDVAFVCLDTKYIAGKMMLVRALEGDMKIIAREPTANPFHKISLDTRISFAAFVPLQVQEMLTFPDSVKKLNQLKVIIVGGGEVSTSLQTEIEKLQCAVYATYGMTETVSHIALQRLNGKEASKNFTTLPGVTIEIDERGCLVIQLPEFQEKIRTNDLISLAGTNSFTWLGRFDNVINSGGFKILPEKIEKVIASTFQERAIARQFFVCGIPDGRWGQKLILAIEGFPISGEKKILAALNQHLHPYEVPKQIFHIREFIRTETGKINRPQTRLLLLANYQ